jgi:hypothetical protein
MKKKIISAVIFLILFSSIYLPLIPNVKAEELPDLVVSSIEITPQQPRNGQPFMLIITVTNLGSGEVPCSYLLAVNITRDTTYIDSISYGVSGNLTQDASVSLSWDFLNGLPGGKYTVRAVADPWHHYTESNETNNVLTFNYTVVTTTILTLSSPANAKIGETVTLKARFTDSNGNPLGGHGISFKIGNLLIGSNATDSTGNASINYKITVAAGTYTVSARYYGSSLYTSSNATTTIHADPLTLTITGDVKNAQIVSVNGTLYTTDASGKAVITINQLGAYAVQILTPYNLNQTTRIAFVQWNDGTTNNQKTITMNSDQTYSITTIIQYYLSVTSAYSNTQGSGWYDSGSEASFSVSPTTVSSGFLTYNVFHSWSGDYTGTGSTGTITMNSPKEIVAQWATDDSQLYIAVEALALVIIIILIAILLMRRRKPTSK